VKWTVLGLVLIALGVLALVFRGIPYKTEEKVLDVGPIHATAEQDKTFPVPPYAGAAAVGVGALLLLMGGRRR